MSPFRRPVSIPQPSFFRKLLVEHGALTALTPSSLAPDASGDLRGQTIADYLQLAREGGYLGAWPWSFKGVDTFGVVA
jgi:hypothetical protein